MIHNERTLDIEAPPEKVWAVLDRFMEIDAFHPSITSVEVLSKEKVGVGASRKCNFTDGTSVVEDVVAWQPGTSYRVRLSQFSMPLKEAYAELSVEPKAGGGSRARMAMDYRVKFGPVGWLMGQTMMKAMTGKIFAGVLGSLDEYVRSQQAGPEAAGPPARPGGLAG